MTTVREMLEKINIQGVVKFDEPMALHTSFRVGGAADAYLVPKEPTDVLKLMEAASGAGIPVFILGKGANILVSDRGIRGLVLDLRFFNEISVEGTVLNAGAGCDVSDVCTAALRHGLTGFEFINAMPGSVGGAIYMNARCYDVSVSDVLEYVLFIDEHLDIKKERISKAAFSYKRSPFQGTSKIILGGGFRLEQGDVEKIKSAMETFRADREKKGHFLAPSAGSVFKNNRAFGVPTGKLIDSLGLKGLCQGGAQIAPFHGNIIINRGHAKAQDILELIRIIETRVKSELGFDLEREIILVGDWEV